MVEDESRSLKGERRYEIVNVGKKLWQSWPLEARNVHPMSVHCAAGQRPQGLTNYELLLGESSHLLQGSCKQKACLCATMSAVSE